MTSLQRCSAPVILAMLSACTADEAIRAGVNTAIHVATTTAYVAATGGCFGDCSYGTHCDGASSMCVPDREEDITPVSDPAVDPQLQIPPIPAIRGYGEPIGACEVSGGACVDEGASCTFAHDECVGQCRCVGLAWQCLENCW